MSDRSGVGLNKEDVGILVRKRRQYRLQKKRDNSSLIRKGGRDQTKSEQMIWKKAREQID